MFFKTSCPSLPGVAEAPITATLEGLRMASNWRKGSPLAIAHLLLGYELTAGALLARFPRFSSKRTSPNQHLSVCLSALKCADCVPMDGMETGADWPADQMSKGLGRGEVERLNRGYTTASRRNGT